MFRHVVVFRFNPDVTHEQKQSIIDELRTLPGIIPELRDYRVGLDAGVNEGNHELAVTADFDHVDSYLVYRDHPQHQRIIVEHIRPATTDRAAVQYEI